MFSPLTQHHDKSPSSNHAENNFHSMPPPAAQHYSYQAPAPPMSPQFNYAPPAPMSYHQPLSAEAPIVQQQAFQPPSPAQIYQHAQPSPGISEPVRQASIEKASKCCKFAISSLQYEDIETARKYLMEALERISRL
jgi:vacuolar protein sorting-associated protein VTA1